MHCSCSELEVSRTYGSMQTSTSWLLRERPVCGTPCTYTIVLTLTTTQSSHSWWKGRHPVLYTLIQRKSLIVCARVAQALLPLIS